MLKVTARIILGSLVLLGLVACSGPAYQERAIQGKTMGTTYTIKYIKNENQNIILPALKADIDDALIEVNALMSTYDPNSELSRLNRHEANVAFPVSSKTRLVLNEALRLAKLSEGRLDVTIGPLVNLWGFGPDKRPETVPTSEELQSVSQYVGIDKFSLASDGVTKQHQNVYIDLSTIAKGYGVDVVADILESRGINDYLVEIGGEMRVKGDKGEARPWRIAIEKPVVGRRDEQKIISIGDNAIATSGDYRNYYEFDGKRFSHLIDPTTSYPIEHNLVSVTVVHASSMTADGLATALIILGPDKAKELAIRNNLAVFLVLKGEDGFDEYASPAFNNLVSPVLN